VAWLRRGSGVAWTRPGLAVRATKWPLRHARHPSPRQSIPLHHARLCRGLFLAHCAVSLFPCCSKALFQFCCTIGTLLTQSRHCCHRRKGAAIRRPCSFPTLLASPFACRFVFDLHRRATVHAPSTASSTASLQSQIPDVHAADLRVLRPNRVVFGGSADHSHSICIYPFYIL